MITIIIPAYNRAELVKLTLQSVLEQTYRPLKVILVDNNSTDATLSVLSSWAQQHQDPDFDVKVISEPKPGAPAARNAALALVDTEWTMYFDSDDVMEPGHVARAMACAAANPEANLIGWDVRMITPGELSVVKPFEPENPYFHCVMHGSLATQRYMAKTELFRQAGAWREDVKVWNDIELGVRLLPHAKIAKSEGPTTVNILVHDASITGANYSHNGEAREHSIRCIADNLPPELLWIAELKRVILAADYYKEGAKEMAQRLYGEVAERNQNSPNMFAYRLAYAYAKTGMRGAARLFRFFFKQEKA